MESRLTPLLLPDAPRFMQDLSAKICSRLLQNGLLNQSAVRNGPKFGFKLSSLD